MCRLRGSEPAGDVPTHDSREVAKYHRPITEAAVSVGEALLPLSFTGLLPQDDGANSAFYRAVGGLAHTLWRLDRINAAERTLLSLLYVNPLDNYGARDLLPLVRSGRRWTADLDDE